MSRNRSTASAKSTKPFLKEYKEGEEFKWNRTINQFQRPGSKKRHQTNGALALPLLLPLFIDLQEGLREFWPRHARRSLGEGGYSVGEMPATLVSFSSVFSVSLLPLVPTRQRSGRVVNLDFRYCLVAGLIANLVKFNTLSLLPLYPAPMIGQPFPNILIPGKGKPKNHQTWSFALLRHHDRTTFPHHGNSP